MNVFQAKEIFNNVFKDKKLEWGFDNNCMTSLCCFTSEGLPNSMHVIYFNKVKLTLEDGTINYIPIEDHQATMTWAAVRDFMSKFIDSEDVFVMESELRSIAAIQEPEILSLRLKQLQEITGISEEKIAEKITPFLASYEKGNQPSSQDVDLPVDAVVNE